MFALGFRHKLIIGLTTACLVLLVVAAFTYGALASSNVDRQWVAHTNLVLVTLSDLQSQIANAETGERGFLLTGDPAYLDPYLHARVQIPDILSRIRQLTADNATQQMSLDSLESHLTARLEALAQVIGIRQHNGLPAAQIAVSAGSGRLQMEATRAEISTLKAEENRLLLIRNKEFDSTTRRAKLFIILGEAVGFGFLLLAGAMVHQEMNKRRCGEEEIRRLNADLELRVAERTQDLAARSKDLERSNMELQQFAYVASHDLQEPLRTISSFTQLLAKRYREQLDDKAREFIDFAVDGCKRLQTLINDLLAFSRVGSEIKPLRPISCDVVLDRALRSLRAAIQESAAQIQRSSLPVVMADEVQLVQLFQNLLANAIKFRGQQAPRIHVFADRQNDLWTISVRDNGIGISPEHNDRIFVIFQRLHTSSQYSGTGIGLAVCKKIAERHGGHISVRPAPEGGSIFSFTLNPGEISHASSTEEKTHSELRKNAATH